MNLSEVKTRYEAEKEYKSNIPSIVAEIKAKAMAEMSTEIELIRSTALDKINWIVEKYSNTFEKKIESVKLLKGDPGKDAEVDYNLIEKKIKALIPVPIPGKDAIVDYPKIIKAVIKKIPPPAAGVDAVVDYDLVIKEVLTLLPPPTKPIINHDKLAKIMIGKMPKVKKHGSGDTVAAGTGITITKVGGRKVINSTASSSGAIIATTDTGDHQNFTLAQAPTTSNYYIIFNDGIYLPTSATFPFSIAGSTLTFVTAIPSDMVGKELKFVCI